ncbi:zf-HC2 domain-containing protein [Desulfitobacterium sp.]|uniref:zf-HC2 domain-containing protein n=1 Tax=Desulfitobacterium sp. TaxID=49981 RepID=UPI002B1E9F5F|nr:zf-HC2 domain-containing protein [Desulfitobacterium sp.]MEA4900737.1 zf-HC2 domain-containing protein [Desulfitobacterium sp.]
MKCDVIRDLLPAYIDGLTSATSNEEIERHLAGCRECQTFHREMTGEIEEEVPVAVDKEVDYLKKVRMSYTRRAVFVAGGVAVCLLVLIGLFAVGFSVSSQDMDMTYEVRDNHLEIHFQLKNGHDLIGSYKPEIIYDENHKVIGIGERYRPKWVFNNPFDDVGSTFTLGSELPGPDAQDGFTNTITIEFADKTVQFINGRLVGSPL